MDIATIVGLLGAFGLILYAIGPNLGSFIDLKSILIVIGGSTSLAFLGFPLKTVIGAINYYCYAFVYPNFEEDEKKIRENLETYIFYFERLMTFHKGCGGIGILIGFILVCQNLNDPASIGPVLAVMLLSILYALVMAYVIFLPVKTKLECHVKNLVAQS